MKNNLGHRVRRLKDGLSMAFLGLVLLFPGGLLSQASTAGLEPLDTIKMKPLNPMEKEEIDGFFNKMFNWVKFKENKTHRQEELIHDYLDSLILNGELQVDSASLNKMIDQINAVFIVDSTTIGAQKVDIQASKNEIDSLKITVKAILKEMAKEPKSDEIKKTESSSTVKKGPIDPSLKNIRAAQYTCTCLENTPTDSRSMNDTLCLIQKKMIIGWHNAWNKSEYKNYNFNYLSAINLYGYELSVSGRSKNPKVLEAFKRPGGVISYAKKKATDVYLTVYSKSPKVISSFLKNKEAQDALFVELETLLDADTIQGVNIFFEDVSVTDSKRFENFILTLRMRLSAIQKRALLTLTIPSVANSKRLKKINAYDFLVLTPLIDYYLILTDQMIGLNSTWAQSSSPLHASEKSVQWSIESTVNFYSNGKIPLSKIIISVSYLGINWPVYDFTGRVNINRTPPQYIQYNEIIQSVVQNRDLKDSISMGFDTLQVAPYINVTNTIVDWNGETNYNQIWYEDSRSLKEKYLWILENDLAGVSIRGLGYDDGYSDLWDVLATSLIDVVSFDPKNDEPPEQIKAFCSYDDEYESLSLFSLKNWGKINTHFQAFIPNAQDTSAQEGNEKIGFAQKIIDDVKWASLPDTNLFYKTENYDIKQDAHPAKYMLNNIDNCKCLIDRWVFYSKLSLYLFALCLVSLILMNMKINRLDRYNQGGWLIRTVIKSIMLVALLLGLFFLAFGIYMAPWWDSIGASSNGSYAIIYIITLPVLGMLLGWFIKKQVDKGKYVLKDLP